MLLNTEQTTGNRLSSVLPLEAIDIHHLYDEVAEQYSRDDAKFRDDLISRPFIVELARLFGANKKVLDFGCGDGHVSRLVSPFAKSILGVDYSSKMIQQARLKTSMCRNVQFQRINFLNLAEKISGGTFDLCLAVYAFCCMKDLRHLRWAFRQMAHALKQKGRAIIQIPHPDESNNGSRSAWIEDIDSVTDDARGRFVRRKLRMVGGGWVLVARYHYLLNDYLDAIHTAGLMIEDTFEPKASRQLLGSFPSLSHESEVASSIVFVVRKG